MEAILYSRDTGQPMVRLRDPRALEDWAKLCLSEGILVCWSKKNDTPCGVAWLCPTDWVPMRWNSAGILQ